MKKIFIILMLISSCKLTAELRLDPATQVFYTYPSATNIDQAEYVRLVININEISKCHIYAANNHEAAKIIKDLVIHYLKTVGTPTALRLINDINKNMIYYPDGTPGVKIWTDL